MLMLEVFPAEDSFPALALLLSLPPLELVFLTLSSLLSK